MGNTQSSNARHSQEEQIRQIDGGPLELESGVYTAPQDWKKGVVRALQLARRMAPYYKGLDDYDEAWSDEKLMHVLQASLPQNSYNQALLSTMSDPSGRSNPPSTSQSSRASPSRPSSLVDASSTTSTKPVRPRATTMESLSQIQSVQRPKKPFGILLYQNAVECPICFLYYPANIATTRCCRQPICTECFVQIRRPNPHAPVVHADDPNPPAENTELLIMESPVCPYCNLPDFGIIYDAPDFKIPRAPYTPLPASERDISPTDNRVVLTDTIRPDWTAKLQRAKDRAARRAANAALILAHLQRQERRAQEARTRGSRSRRRDVEALEEAQLAEAIRLSALEEEERQSRSQVQTDIRSRPTSEMPQSSTAALSMANSAQASGVTESYVKSMPLPELIYAPPADSYRPPPSLTGQSSYVQSGDIE